MTEKETTLYPAYLVVGSDELKVETIIKRLSTRLENLGNLDFNSQIVDGSKSLVLDELLDSLNTPPLAAPFRLVVIKNIDKGGKLLVEALTRYLKSPLLTTIVVMTAAKLTQQSSLYKAVKRIDNKAIIDASDRKRSELPAMVRQLAQNYQITLSHEGATKLADLVGASTIALNTEVKKLSSYVVALGRSEATLEDVITVVARTNQPSPWDFVEAFSKRDLAQSFDVLASLPRESPVSLLYLCVTRIRELLHYCALTKRREGSIAKALGKQDWQLRRLEALAQKFTTGELRALLAQAAHADARMKSGENARLVLEELLLATCR